MHNKTTQMKTKNALLDDVNNKVDDIKKKLNSILGNNN